MNTLFTRNDKSAKSFFILLCFVRKQWINDCFNTMNQTVWPVFFLQLWSVISFLCKLPRNEHLHWLCYVSMVTAVGSSCQEKHTLSKDHIPYLHVCYAGHPFRHWCVCLQYMPWAKTRIWFWGKGKYSSEEKVQIHMEMQYYMILNRT